MYGLGPEKNLRGKPLSGKIYVFVPLATSIWDGVFFQINSITSIFLCILGREEGDGEAHYEAGCVHQASSNVSKVGAW